MRTRAHLGWRRVVLGRLWLGLAVIGAAEPSPPPSSPLGARGLRGGAPLSSEEAAELAGLAETVNRYETLAAEYREATRQLIEFKYQQKRDLLFNSYEAMIVKLELEQRARRDGAIAKFETFLDRYPDDERYTPDAMFRLSELYFERSYDEYFQARQSFEKALEQWTPKSRQPEPEEPVFHYEPTIGMMQRLITEYPRYRLVDGAYYLLGFCLGEQGEEERAVDIYLEMVDRYPDSRFAAEVWTRIGEFYFATNELQLAMAAYVKVLGHYDSPFYDKAMYKLAWTHYRLADPERTPEEFQKAVDTFVELLEFNEKTKAEGKERGSELRKESVQYIAISYADEQWGGLDKLLAYFERLGPKPYEREVLTALGDVYFDQTRFVEAVRAYDVVQARFGDHVDAPVLQEKIITAHERNRDFVAAATAREKLSAAYGSGGSWWKKNENDEAALKNANELVRKSLYSAALFHHKQAQIHKEANKTDLAVTSYRQAAKSYGDYLERFPHDRQLYELRYYFAESLYYSLQFEAAAEQYLLVRDSNADNRFLEPAAFSVILALERMVSQQEQAGTLLKVQVARSADRAPGGAIEPREIPELKQRLIVASDRYAAAAPNDEKVPKVLYKAAETYYVYDHLPEARQRFESLLGAYPANEVAEYAANLIVETYLAEQNFVAVEQFTRSLLERPATPGRKEFKGELVKFKTGAMFKLAEDLDANKEYERAAEMYLKLIAENPNTQFADSALNNAAVDFERVKRYDSASKLYERLVKEYPKSPLADTALFRVGVNAERFFDFERAIATYSKLVKDYPKSERRADALYNAALALENTQEYERSAAEYLRYCQLFPRRDDAPEVCFRAGVVYEKMSERQRAVATFKAFINKYRNNSAHAARVVEAYLRIAKILDAQDKEKEARQYFETTLTAFARAVDKNAVAPYAAEAHFALAERESRQFNRIKITGSGKEQAKALQRKATLLKQVEAAYQKVLPYKQIEWTLAASYRIGQIYQNMATVILEAPCPPEFKRDARRMGYAVEELCDQYRVQLEDKAINVEEKAVQAFEKAVGNARELQVANQWTKLTLVALNKLRRTEWPLQKDAKLFVADALLAPPPAVDATGKPLVREPPAASEPAPAEPPVVPAPAESPAPPASVDVPTPMSPGAAPNESTPSSAPTVAPTPLAPATPLGASAPPPPPPPAPAGR